MATASYREIRNFVEIMRQQGYPRLISVENFRSPNFKLSAEILVWLARRFDANADIPTAIDSEQDRVIFVKAVAQFFAIRSGINLNTKRLYQADNTCVSELLKIAMVLHNSLRGDKNKLIAELTDERASGHSMINFDVSGRANDLKEARRLASDITQKGALLHDLLGKEVDLREERMMVIAKQLDLAAVERGLQQSMVLVEQDIQKVLNNLENIAADEANLESKIEKKKQELERNQKRLATLQVVRPAYMDEFEEIEAELQRLYQEYIVKFRNVTYLEQQFEALAREETEKLEQIEDAVRKLGSKIKDGKGDYDDFGALDDVPEVEGGKGLSDDEGNGDARNQLGRGRPSAPVGQRKPAVPSRDNLGKKDDRHGRPGESSAGRKDNFGSMGLNLSDDDDEHLLNDDRGEFGLDDEDEGGAGDSDEDGNLGGDDDDDDLGGGRSRGADRNRASNPAARAAPNRRRRDMEDDDNDF